MESKIQRILNDPEAMGAVLSMARSLGVSGAPSVPSPTSERSRPAPESGDSGPGGLGAEGSGPGGLGAGGSGLEGLSELLGSADPATMGKLLGLLGEYTRDDDRRVLFLKALKPYLRPERAGKIERAGQLVRLARTAGKALESWNEK